MVASQLAARGIADRRLLAALARVPREWFLPPHLAEDAYGAAAPGVPPPLVAQLALGGRLVIPIGDLSAQELVIFTRTPAGLDERRAGGVRFVPLISRLAFTEGEQN